MGQGRNVSYRYRQLRKVLLRPGAVCWVCGCGLRFDVDKNHPQAAQLDHVVPASRGGKDVRDNLRPICRMHNLKKGKKVALSTPKTSESW